VPKDVPKKIIDQLYRALAEAAKNPTARAQLERLGAEPVTNVPPEFARYMRAEYAKYGKTIEAAGLKID
jgi:tripartite-type tricarboxylate transporter receptor subunit TctC